MGDYLNYGNRSFSLNRNDDIYVDKSMLLSHTNSFINKSSRFVCVSRPRRFGKTMAANMVAAYYDESCDSRNLFSDLEIAGDPSFGTHLNRYPVIKFEVTHFCNNLQKSSSITRRIEEAILEELRQEYSSCLTNEDNVAQALNKISKTTGKQFVIVIDEWDAIFREYKNDEKQQNEYLGFLRSLFKDEATNRATALCYMTGILPIKKYNTQSTLKNFSEYTMLDPLSLAPFVGFLEPEVRELCSRYEMDFDEVKRRYDGYSFAGIHSVYSPFSVSKAISNRKIKNYWTDTSAADEARDFINRDFSGLRRDILKMLSNEHCRVETGEFQNDFVSLHDKDQVMTLLIHLGYLAYDEVNKEAFIPNQEVSEKLSLAIRKSNWEFFSEAISQSEDLLHAAWNCEEEKVAQAVELFHDKNSSIWSYNQENDLVLALKLAFYAAQKDYDIRRELEAGKGFADLAFVPKKNTDVIPMIIELKWNRSADTAIDQIKRREYSKAFLDYTEVLICGINYDKTTKKHTCRIEKIRS